MQHKKPLIVQLEPLDLVSTVQLKHEHLITIFPCETWQSAGTCRHQ